MSSVDGFSFNAIAKSENLQYVLKKAGYCLPKAEGAVRDLAMSHYDTLKEKIKSEISEAKKSGLRSSITNDESTSTRNRRFMNINAHFQSTFQSLGMARVNGSLPGTKCAELVLKRLGEHGIDLWMLVCFTTDGARVMGKFIKSLPIPILHQECLTQGIHLAGKYFLLLDSFSDSYMASFVSVQIVIY